MESQLPSVHGYRFNTEYDNRDVYSSQRVYEVRPRKDHRGVDLIPDVLPFGRLWYREPNAVSNAQLTTRSFAVDHIMRRSTFDTRPHPMNILPQSMKRLFH